MANAPTAPSGPVPDNILGTSQRTGTSYAGVAPAPVEAERLQAAAALLARLPTSVLPQTGGLVTGSRLPLSRNPLFTGREANLRALAQRLGPGPATAGGRVAAILGASGIGKSQLALEFAYRYGQFFAGGVYWLDFSTADNVPAEVGECKGAADPASQADFDQQPQSVRLKLVLAAWQSQLPRLLIFDNCQNDKLLETWRPPTGSCRVLLTSRHLHWPVALGVQPQVLGPLQRPESLALLHKFRPDLPPSDPGLNAVANELGDLPLALHLAGRYLEHYRDVALGQPTTYLAWLHSAIRQDGPGQPSAGADPRVAGAFQLNSEVLNPIHPVDALARQTLAQAACLAPDIPIPRALLQRARDVDPLSDTARLFDEALRRLARLGLVEEAPQGAVRLPEMVVRLVLAEIDAPAVSEQMAVALLGEAERLNAAGDATGLQTWQAHLSWVARTAERRRSPQAGRLYNELGYHARLRGSWAQARHYHERALRLGQATLGRDHPELVTWHNNLGRVLKTVGDLPGARAQLQRALSIGQQALGPDSADVATLHNNLGLLLHDLGDLQDALPHFESALAIGERTLGPNHPAMSVRHSNLGRLLFDLDKLADARSHYERALAIGERAYGPDHPDVATLHNHLNVVLAALDTQAPEPAAPASPLEAAEPALETAEAANWHDTRGLSLYVQGELPQAHYHFERALAITEQTFGRSYPALAYRHTNLGRVLHDLGDIGEAQLNFERALRIGEAAFGPDHPDMANWHNNLGRVLHEQGDMAVARLHFERALAVAQQNLGPNHPDVVTLRRNLELVLEGDGKAKVSPRIIDRLTRFIRRARP